MAEDYFKDFDDDIYENGANKKQIKCIQSYHYSSIYGAYSVQSHLEQKFTWTFRINRNARDRIWIGISSSYVCDQDCFTNKKSSNYSCSLNGDKWSKGIRGTYHSKKFYYRDTISMTLDCSTRELSFSRNGKDLGVCYDDIDVDESIQYKMAVIMAKKDDQIELTHFRMGDQAIFNTIRININPTKQIVDETKEENNYNGKEQDNDYDGPWIEKRIEWKCPDRKRHNVVLFGSWNRFKGGNELEYQGKQIFACNVKIPLGTYVYRFLIDGEEWETHNNAPKTARDGIEYNQITIAEDSDEEEEDEEEDDDLNGSDDGNHGNTNLMMTPDGKLTVGS